MSASGVILLEGGCNFRDLGGYQTTDGRTVRSGQLYRSGVLSYLTAADQTQLADLGIGAICDLRRAQERLNEPTQWFDESVRVLAWDDGRDVAMVSPLSGVTTAEQAQAGMLELYRNMPDWLAPRLRAMFQYLVEQPAPMLFHCAAGKDRTGLAAALVLTVLGVPRETILMDYAVTNEAVNLEQFISQHRRSNLGLASAGHPIFTVPTEARQVLFRADPAYLEAALTAVETRPGGMDSYLADDLGLQDHEQKAIVDRLLV